MPEGSNKFDAFHGETSTVRDSASPRPSLLGRIVQKIRRFFSPAEKAPDSPEAYLEGSPAQRFRHAINLEEARREGRAEAARHHPPADSTTPADSPYCARLLVGANTVNMRIKSRFARIVAHYSREITRPLRDLGTRLQLRVNRAIDVEMAETERRALPDIVEAYRRAQRAQSRFRKWLVEQNLDRETPDQPDLLRTAIIFLLVLCAEGMTNALALQDAVRTGARGAAELGLISAAINLASGMAAGFLFGRMLHDVAPSWRLGGRLGSACCFIAAAYLHFWFAGVRYLTITTQIPFDQAMRESGRFVRQHPEFLVDDLLSAVLFLGGLALWTLAFFKGTTSFTDPYPGFSRKYARMQAAQALADERYAAFEEQLTEIAETAGGDIEEMRGEAEIHVEHQRAHLAGYERVVTMVGGEQGLIEESVHNALRAYADGQSECRADVPAPVWLGRVMNLNFEWPKASSSAFDQMAANTHEHAARLYGAVTQAQEDLGEAIRASIARVELARLAALGSPADPPESPLPQPSPIQLRRGYGTSFS